MNVSQETDELLSNAISSQASDIHFCPFGDNVFIYYRIHGNRIHKQTLSLSKYEQLLSYLKFTSGMDIGEILIPQNGVSFLKEDKESYALRLSTLPVQSTESLAIRILPQRQVPQLNELFLYPNQLQRIKSWMNHRAGLVLFTGPTGSGKTTTLYALLQSLLAERSVQTITLEDPIENQLKDILQVQVNEKAGIDYNAGLKAALRHDPDILMVGEIRDATTAKFAIRAAQTGHLVLSSLHAKDAFGTLSRMLEMGVTKTDLQQTLVAVASQQLLPLLQHDEVSTPHTRAAILELLDNNHLLNAFNGISPYQDQSFPSFPRLRRKAYALGYISKQII
ncbi:competence protein [Pontibacillus yanchengensis]|uniref:Competence protein n=2 Tax=Pontibacillus yanchengensis TaxID=462910 RepID=A0ACC7VF12_9BACI|nr:competence type IV pilus ATPase ComGA [Pontibacillus yanchengensis]MYL33493.1 competence protein [Pontibacillus yanchengensis]MYL53543.1 competence protein [Pontibacillus yanchengensis]